MKKSNHKRGQEQHGSEAKLWGFLESAPDAIVIADRKGQIVLVNAQTEKMFGYQRDELIGEPVEILVPERFRKVHAEHRTRYLSEPSTRPMGAALDLVGRCKDGREFPVEISLSPMETEEGLLITSAIRDITERKRAEEEIRKLNQELEQRVIERTAELREEKNKAQKYLDVAGVIFTVIGADQKVILINKKGCEVLEYEENEIIGKNWFDLFLPQSVREQVKAVFVKLMAGEIEPVEYFQNPVLTKTGEERIIAWHNAVLRDEDGKIYAALGSGEDITEKLMLEQQIRQAEKLAAIGQLTSGLAHEIGTPLNVITGRAEYMLRKMSPEDPLRGNLERIILQIERITKIVNQLLSFTRTKPLEIKPLRLASMLQEVLSFFDHQMEQHGITKALDCSETLPEILADSDQIQQVCFNIVLNAIQAMPQGGKLTIHVSRTVPRHDREDLIKDQYIKIEIADTGIGISPEHLSRVFDPFFTTKEAGKGTGLGLAVSYSIARNHGGWISVKSQVGEGSAFCLYLPVKPILQTESSPLGEKAHG